MQKSIKPTPSEHDAAAIVQMVLNEPARAITRFPTGLCHYVYDVVTESNTPIVVRIAGYAPEALRGAVYWSEQLRPLGVPLPRILYADLAAESAPFPFMVLERLPGTDLNHVYPQLSVEDKREIARGVVRAQTCTHNLPLGKGFGFALNYDWPFLHRTWTDALLASLNSGRDRLAETGIFDSSCIVRLHAKLLQYKNYLSGIQPVAFLDDTTTKNVIIHNGRLSGIVDVDGICFGDPIFPIALTQMSLLNSRYDLDYIDIWCDLIGMTAEQRRILDLYTAIFCVDFMGEIGRQAFNKDTAPAVAPGKVQHLKGCFENLLNAF